MRALTPILLAAVACGPKDAAPEAPTEAAVTLHDPSQPRSFPDPLEPTPFEIPTPERRTLTNGLEVVVVTNDEVPLVDVTVAFKVGGFLDEIPDQAQVTFDMLNEGAADRSAEDISRSLKRMASDLSTGANSDGAAIRVKSLRENLAPTLAIMRDVLVEPTFPEDEWAIVKKRYVAGVEQARKDPSAIASRVDDRIFYGDAYRGRIPMVEDYDRLDPDAMRAFHQRYVGPENAIVLVGGAITADEVVPLLEESLGAWKPEGVEAVARPEIVPELPDESTLFFVDKPDAAQSVVRAYTRVGTPTDEDWFPWTMGVDVLGGTFMSRLNLNLREDKGYTYGARCYTSTRYGDRLALCAANVQTEVTGPSLDEMRRELSEVQQDDARPITADELDYLRSTRVNGYPRRFETPGALLSEQESIWRYGLPEDWPERYLPAIQAVSVDEAQRALTARWDLDRTVWLVVGDKAVIGESLESFGLPIVELDVDGNRIGG
jgi:zinc protease